MSSSSFYTLLADIVVVVHFAFVAFVVVSPPLIWLGGWRRWGWVKNLWFRGGHLLAIGIVAGQALCGIICPLTTWENKLRLAAGQGTYAGSFIQHWVHRVLFYEGNPAVFTVCYVLFFVAVLATLWLVPPRWPWRAKAAQIKP